MKRHHRSRSAWQRFIVRLRALPPPGRGLGLHGELLGVANLGVMVGVDAETLVEQILTSIPPGNRVVPRSEVEQAVRRASYDHGAGGLTSSAGGRKTRTRRRQPAFDPAVERARLIRLGGECSFDDLVNSPTNVCREVGAAAAVGLIRGLFRPDDLLYLGSTNDDRPTVKPAGEWVAEFERFIAGRQAQSPNGGPPMLEPYGLDLMITNPLTGEWAPRKDGQRLTLIGDNCVARHAYAIAEYDTLSLPEQCSFWRGWSRQFPGWLLALVYSGGKSLHAWLRVNARDAEDWRARVSEGLFGEVLIPLGVDPTTRNPARRTRIPGVGAGWALGRPGGPPFTPRKATQLLFLSPNAEAIR